MVLLTSPRMCSRASRWGVCTILTVLTLLYVLSVVGLSVVGFNMLALSVLYLVHRQSMPAPPNPPSAEQWPHVVVQLPIYNERHVVERLLDAAVALAYPRDRLEIQVLDDSTDETAAITEAAVKRHREQGVNIQLIRRPNREGFKAGALAHGLTLTDADFVAIFDADFVPRSDFLNQVLPYFLADEWLGMVQTRWSHLNDDYNSLTRAQALALDAHFVVEHTARQRSGLLTNFSGTGGVWRQRCINESGGWQSDTLSEDKDLSYRAQLGGWRCLHLPDIDSPGEIPPTITALKRQQGRWATGTVQCLFKLGGRILQAPLTFWQKLEALLHLGELFVYPLMFIMLLLCPLLMLSGRLSDLPLAPLSLAILGPPLAIALGQQRLYRDWPRRLLALPLVVLLGVGMAINNTLAVLQAFSPKPPSFQRTPKYQIQGQDGEWSQSVYRLPIDYTTWLELAMALYVGLAAWLALRSAPGLVPFLIVWTLAFGYVGGMGLWQAGRAALKRRERFHIERVLPGRPSA